MAKKSTSSYQRTIPRTGAYGPVKKAGNSGHVKSNSAKGSYPVKGHKGRKGAGNSSVKNHA